MGVDLKIVVLDGDSDDFDLIRKDLNLYWQYMDIHRTEVEVLDIGYYKPFVNGFLVDHYDDGILGNGTEFLVKLKQQQENLENLIDNEYVTDEEEFNSVKDELENLISTLENLSTPFTNQQILMVRY